MTNMRKPGCITHPRLSLLKPISQSHHIGSLPSILILLILDDCYLLLEPPMTWIVPGKFLLYVLLILLHPLLHCSQLVGLLSGFTLLEPVHELQPCFLKFMLFQNYSLLSRQLFLGINANKGVIEMESSRGWHSTDPPTIIHISSWGWDIVVHPSCVVKWHQGWGWFPLPPNLVSKLEWHFILIVFPVRWRLHCGDDVSNRCFSDIKISEQLTTWLPLLSDSYLKFIFSLVSVNPWKTVGFPLCCKLGIIFIMLMLQHSQLLLIK